ncbi:AAA family ATPase [Arenicella chitinivorans]|nr:AAA family ATPase [Arenicella chitinivorans]
MEQLRRISLRSSKAYFQWTVTQGLLRLAEGYQAQSVNRDINQLFGQILSTSQPSVYVLVDFHHYINEPVSIRFIKDVMISSPQHSLVFLSPAISMPAELKSRAALMSLPVPNRQQLQSLLTDLANEWQSERGEKLKLSERKITAALLDSVNGLPRQDAESVLREAIWNDGVLDRQDLLMALRKKFNELNRGGILALRFEHKSLEDIAGFTQFKEWLALRRDVFLGKVSLPGQDIPKGVLLLGVQGCGKSMAAKAVASAWNLPLLYLDFAVLYNRFHGQTEENLRTALDTASGMSPCVLWLDEIEKGLSAVSNSDDTSRRLLGTFLNWLSENTDRVFVVATANDVSALPPELLRKGRFDEVFFVDLPDFSERVQVLKLHLTLREQDAQSFDTDALAEATAGFSGAELEQLVVSAMYQSYAQSASMDTAMLLALAASTRPLSVLMAEHVEGLRNWAADRATPV